MKLLFSLAFFLGSLAFTLYGLSTLDLSDSLGRPGPGYFPLIVGILLIITTGISSIQEYKKRAAAGNPDLTLSVKDQNNGQSQFYAIDTIMVALMILVFLIALKPLGSILSMILFSACFLAYFNKGQLKLNVIYSISLPLGVYLLFDVILRAGLPKGIFD